MSRLGVKSRPLFVGGCQDPVKSKNTKNRSVLIFQ